MSKQRVVVVTGGGSGMGRAIAHRFAANGDKVYVIGRRKEKLEETAKDHDLIKCVVTDVTDLESIKSFKQTLLNSEKSIDVLVNCAGGRGAKTASDDASLEEMAQIWEDIIKINLSSIYYVIQCLRDCITAPGGRIVNISSSAILTGSSQGGVIGTAYAAAKSGIHGIEKTLAKSLGEEGITINSIAPGVVQSTDFFGGGGLPDKIRERYEKTILVGRFGEPEDIAAGVYYLASEDASFITGEILNINGGTAFGR